jgi:hypothetical protein
MDRKDVVAAMLAAAAGRTGENYLLPGHRGSFADLAELARDCSGIAVPGRTVPLQPARPCSRWPPSSPAAQNAGRC